MANFKELVSIRQSDRAYTNQKVEKEKILQCIEAARLAPSACNSQPWKFIIVDEPSLKNEVADATSTRAIGLNHFTKQAPIHVIITQEKPKFTAKLGGIIKHKDFSQMDIGIAAEHFCLQAADLGLGTCMLGWFDEKKVKKLLNIPDKKRVILIITLGYPAKEIRVKRRKTLEEIISFNKY